MMADTQSSVDPHFHKDGVCQVECIVVDDGNDAEEDILFINSRYTSVSSQTDSQYFSTYQPSIPGVPIFYCGQPSPGVATTQCFIPHLEDACVGTDPSDTCTVQHQRTHPPGKPTSSVSAAQSTTSHSDIAVKREIMLETEESGSKCLCIIKLELK